MKNVRKAGSALSSECEICVIGAGIIGLSVAWKLKQAGKRVLILDDGRQGASPRAGGMLRPITEHSGETDFLELCLTSAGMWRGFAEELERESGKRVGYAEEGNLMIAKSAEEAEGIRGKLALARRQGQEARELSPEELRNLAPQLAEAEFAAWVGCDTRVDTGKALEALRGLLKEEIIEARAEKIGQGEVETEKRRIRAEKIILCAGAWSGLLEQRLRVRPIKGQMLRYASHLGLRHIVSRHPYYLIPKQDGTLLVGSTEEDAGFDESATAEGGERLRKGAEELMPGLRGAEILEHWGGLRPHAERPLLGKLRDGVYAATGHFRNGWLLAPVTAELMKHCALEGRKTGFEP